MAADHARQALIEDVNDPEAHQLLALALLEQQKYVRDKDLGDALQSAQTAVQLAPDRPFAQYVLALVYTELQDWKRASDTIAEVLQREPAVPQFWNLSATIHMHFNRWERALEDIGRGLQLDPENTVLQRNRATCLISLGRRGEVVDTLESALRHDPENASVHVSQGYALLHQGKYREAMQHYSEALRLDPMNRSAKAGMLEAMRARNPVYALLLRFFLWMTRFDRKTQMGIMIGGILAVRIINNIFKDSQPLIAGGVTVLWGTFILLTWVARPMVNLILRLDKEARHMLSDEEILASNFIGGLVLLALTCVAAAAILREGLWLGAAMGAICLMLPVTLMISSFKKWVRLSYRGFWGVLAFLMLVAILSLAFGLPGLAEIALLGILFGTVAFSWISSFIS